MKYEGKNEYLFVWMDRYGREHTRIVAEISLDAEEERLIRWSEKGICIGYMITALGRKDA